MNRLIKAILLSLVLAGCYPEPQKGEVWESNGGGNPFNKKVITIIKSERGFVLYTLNGYTASKPNTRLGDYKCIKNCK